MISFKLQMTVIIAALLLLIIVVYGIRSRKLQIKHSVLWIFLGVINLIFALFPTVTVYFTNLIGIELPVNAIFLTTIVVAYLLILQLSINSSSSESKKRKIVQKVAILEAELAELKQQVDKLTKHKL